MNFDLPKPKIQDAQRFDFISFPFPYRHQTTQKNYFKKQQSKYSGKIN